MKSVSFFRGGTVQLGGFLGCFLQLDYWYIWVIWLFSSALSLFFIIHNVYYTLQCVMIFNCNLLFIICNLFTYFNSICPGRWWVIYRSIEELTWWGEPTETEKMEEWNIWLNCFLISIIVNFIYPKQTNFLCDTTYATHVMLPLIHSSYHGWIEHKITKENSLRQFWFSPRFSQITFPCFFFVLCFDNHFEVSYLTRKSV